MCPSLSGTSQEDGVTPAAASPPACTVRTVQPWRRQEEIDVLPTLPLAPPVQQQGQRVGAAASDVGVDLTAMPLPGAEDTATKGPATKVRAGHPDRSTRLGASIDPAELTLGLVTARDGTPVRLRPLRRDERDLVAGFYEGLSDDSKYDRFLQPMPRLPKAYLDRLVDVDGCRHVAVVAIVEGECVGIARYIALPKEPGAAEVEVTIADRYQGRGIGGLLVEGLWPAAVRAGLTTLVCYVHPDNRRMLKLLRSLGVELPYRRDLGLHEGRLRLPDQPLVGEPWTTLTNSGVLVDHGPFTRNCGEQSAVISQGVSHR
jgi:ribosomal protein S18 acetylase RimI-like enzyme